MDGRMMDGREQSSDHDAAMRQLATAAKEASRKLLAVSGAQKNRVLSRVADALRGPAGDVVIAANAEDLKVAHAAGTSGALLDRLMLNRDRVDGIARAVEAILALPDPVGAIDGMRVLPNGLQVGQMRVPLGVIAMVYEARPNVTIDAAALCLKSSNACVLRGGKEAFHSNQALAGVFGDALAAEGLPAACVSLVPTTERAATLSLLGLTGLIDVVIPRGGEGLIRFVTDHARVPVIQHYKGVCHVYVDGDAELEMARQITLNAKVQRPGVCNALETLLIDTACAPSLLPEIAKSLIAAGVELRGDARACQIVAAMKPADASDWDAEYLDLILAVAVVDGIDGALTHIAAHGSNHTEVIVTRDYQRAKRFIREVDASAVFVNASTRFNDGGELGLGAEIGISTTKLHAYGPMGLRELTTLKWIAYGDGQVRQ